MHCLFLLVWQDKKTIWSWKVNHTDGDLHLKWYPLRASLWDSLNTIGYTLERFQLDANGIVQTNTITVLAGSPTGFPILPKSQQWFDTHGAEHEGYIEAVGTILHDTTFQFDKNDLMDPLDLRYNYLVYEARIADNIAAEALGLYFRDSTLVQGQLYRYVVSAVVNGKTIASAQIDMNAEQGFWLSQDYEFEFTFPNGLSLTQMSNRLSNERTDFIRLIGKAYGDSIVLRWGPNNTALWTEANKEGYQVFRERVEGDERSIDSLGHIKPWPEEALSLVIAHDSMALVAGQTLYGKNTIEPQGFWEQSSLLQSRFGFALYAAERSSLAANILGLRYVDRDVLPGVTYNYLITSTAVRSPLTGDVLEIENTLIANPIPLGLWVEPLDRSIILHWDKSQNDLYFSAYFVERSEDNGQTFNRLNKNPLVFVEDERLPLNDYLFTDSVDYNYKEYIYRLIGLTPFAEESSPISITAMGIDLTPPPAPFIEESSINDELTTMYIRWSMINDSLPSDFAGYQVLLGEGDVGEFDTLTALLPVDSLQFSYEVPPGIDRLHFFKVIAYDQVGNVSESGSRYIQNPDMIPPEPATNLYGEIDEDGIITLVWDHSPSEDVIGYWVFYSHDLEGLYVPVNKERISFNSFTDTLSNLFVLNETIYYYIETEDDNYNRGEGSDIIELVRPDYVPPLAPFMNQPVNTDTSVIISWTKSASPDAMEYELYRRPFRSGEDWTLVDTFPNGENRIYFDREGPYDQTFDYTVRVRDDAGNYSEYAFPLQGSLVYSPKLLMVNELKVSYDDINNQIKLDWVYNPPGVGPPESTQFDFLLFKSLGGGSVDEWVELDGETASYIDKQIKKGALHNYGVMVVYDTGHSGPISEIQSVLITEE